MKRIIFFILSLSVSLNVFAQSDVINIISSGNVGISSTAPVSAFEVSGSYGQKVTTITGNTTLDETHNTIVCNNGGTAIAVTLPNATTCAGRVYVIKRNNSSSANVTITPTPTLDGQTSFVISMPNQSIEVFSDGTEWKSRVGGLSNNATAWGLSGNSGTVASTSSIGSAANNNFIGTTDANHFVIATNNLERLRFASGGNIGIGTLNPGFLLDINNTADINAFQFRTVNRQPKLDC